MIKTLSEIAEWFGVSPRLLPILLAAVFTVVVWALQAVTRLFDSRNS